MSKPLSSQQTVSTKCYTFGNLTLTSVSSSFSNPSGLLLANFLSLGLSEQRHPPTHHFLHVGRIGCASVVNTISSSEIVDSGANIR